MTGIYCSLSVVRVLSERIMRTECPGLKNSSKGAASSGESRTLLMYVRVSRGGFGSREGFRIVQEEGKLCWHGYRVMTVFQDKCLVRNLCHSEQLRSGKNDF